MGRTTTSSTTIPEMTEQEKQFMELLNGALLPAYLDQMGYNVNTEQVQFQDSEQGQKLVSAQREAQERFDEVSRTVSFGGGVGGGMTLAAAQRDLNNANTALQEAQESYVPTFSYETTKKDSPYLEALKDKYGADSSEYKEGKAKEQDSIIQNQSSLDEIQSSIIENTRKFLAGDYEISDKQKQYIKDSFAPIRESIDKMTSDDLEETRKKWDNFRDAVKDTSLSVTQALDVVSDQVRKTGQDMKEALDTTIETNKALMKMGIEDATGTITKNTNELAARLGRSPSDPEFQNEIQENVAREVERGTLNLAEMQARGELSITERTGSGLEGVAQQKVALAASTGEKMEGAAVGEGGERQNIVTRAGQMRTGLAENEQNMKWQIGAGMVPSQISTGIGTTQFDQALIQQRMANAGSAMGGVQSMYGNMARERYMQPTTTTRQPWSVQDTFGTILGAANMGANIYGGVSQANAMRGFAGGGNSNNYGSPYNVGYGGDYGF